MRGAGVGWGWRRIGPLARRSDGTAASGGKVEAGVGVGVGGAVGGDSVVVVASVPWERGRGGGEGEAASRGWRGSKVKGAAL